MLNSSAVTTLLGASKPVTINFSAQDIDDIKISANKLITH
jgi:hypothetical protein